MVVSYLYDREVRKVRELWSENLKAAYCTEDTECPMQSWFRGKEPGGATEEKNETERKKERQWPSSRYIQFLVLLDDSLRRSWIIDEGFLAFVLLALFLRMRVGEGDR